METAGKGGKQLTMCPCCKLPMVADMPVVDLNTNTISYGPTTMKLDLTQIELLHILVLSYPATVTLSSITKGIWGKHALTDDMAASIRAQISEARNNLRKAQMPFQISVVRGVGYRIEKLTV